MTEKQKQIIIELLEYIDMTRGSIRINFQDDGEIIAYPTPKIKIPEDPLDKITGICYDLTRIKIS